MTTGWKLAIGGVVVVGTTAYMAYLGAATSWQYYVTVDECLANADALGGARVRVSGKIAPGSLRISSDRSEADFFLEGTEAALRVISSGPVPDNLAEAVDVVAEGRLAGAGLLKADKVLTRCASKYEPETPSPSSEEPIRTSRKGDS
ncbi:MAG: cytochrome c maturation protein CcmE [Planctomycetota bacterium]